MLWSIEEEYLVVKVEDKKQRVSHDELPVYPWELWEQDFSQIVSFLLHFPFSSKSLIFGFWTSI
jgi:hypothetical protein